MVIPGDHADTLRAIGRFFEELKAAEIRIADHGKVMQISWRDQGPTRQQRQFDAHQVSALRSLAVAYRGTPMESLGFRASELLRALGEQLDQLRVVEADVAEAVTGFNVTGKVDGAPFARLFTYSDLVAAAVVSRQQRLEEIRQRTPVPGSLRR